MIHPGGIGLCGGCQDSKPVDALKITGLTAIPKVLRVPGLGHKLRYDRCLSTLRLLIQNEGDQLLVGR